MSIKKIIPISYLISLSITIVLAGIDSDPIISLSSILTDIFFMSILIWIVIFPLTYLVHLINEKFQRLVNK